MARIPIYQMAFGQNRDGSRGLVFTSEQQDYTNQSILFTLPVLEPIHHPYDLLEYLDTQEIYFPFLLGDQYIDLVAKLNFPELVFEIPETDIRVIFEIDNDGMPYWPYFPTGRSSIRRMKYVGNEEKYILKNSRLLNLMPVDLYEMDELYNSHRGVFVGLTPNFGTFDLENNRSR